MGTENDDRAGIRVGGSDNKVFGNIVVGYEKGIDSEKATRSLIKDNLVASLEVPKKTRWYEKPLGVLAIGVGASLIAALIWNFFHQ